MNRLDKEQYICSSVINLDRDDRKSMLYKIINVYNLRDLVSTTKDGSMIDLSKVSDEKLINELFEFVKLKKST